MRLGEFFANVFQTLRGRIARPLMLVVPRSSPQPASMPSLISTFLLRSPNPAHYSLTDGIVRPTKNIDLGDAIKLGEQDPLWANRGKAIQGYAMLEQSLCFLLAALSGMERNIAEIVFYKITNADARNKILEKLIHEKHGRKYNLFWNEYFRQLHTIDVKRNEIVHWLSAMNVALNTQDVMIVGMTLIHPASLGQKKPPPNQITSSDLIDFATKCEIFSRLSTMFVGATYDPQMPDAIKRTWLEIFQQLLIYPLPASHPLLIRTQPTPGSQPQSSRA